MSRSKMVHTPNEKFIAMWMLKLWSIGQSILGDLYNESCCYPSYLQCLTRINTLIGKAIVVGYPIFWKHQQLGQELQSCGVTSPWLTVGHCSFKYLAVAHRIPQTIQTLASPKKIGEAILKKSADDSNDSNDSKSKSREFPSRSSKL